MKLRFALDPFVEDNRTLFQNRENLLASYFYFNNEAKGKKTNYDEVIDLERSHDLFIDSGAFSAWNNNVEVDINKYIEFLLGHKFSLYAGLDVIHNAEATWKNQKYMESKGLKPLPTFHVGSHEDFLRQCLEYESFCIGGMAFGNDPQPTLDKIWSMIIKRAPNAKVHGFALTDPYFMTLYPWYSVDSSSWTSPSRFGRFGLFNNGRITTISLTEAFKMIDIDFLDLGTMDKDLRNKILKFQIEQFRKLEEHINNQKRDYSYLIAQKSIFDVVAHEEIETPVKLKISRPSVKILSCIPLQRRFKEAKLEWLEETIKKHRPDIFVTPQEYFGGASMMFPKVSFSEKELMPEIETLCKTYNTAFVLGVEEAFDDCNKEAIWFIEKDGTIKGKIYKFALPAYDHVSTNGYGDIVPETNFESRFKTFELCELNVGGLFCWEVYSDVLWAGLALAKPDVVFNLIKFGANSWPIKGKVDGKTVIKDFGYGTWSEEDTWLERLIMANKYEVKCPIISSTNSWELKPISQPYVGSISKIPGQLEKETFWKPTKETKFIPEMVVIDYVDKDKIRLSKDNKFRYKEITGEFPPFDLARFTMLLKIGRIEDRILSGKEQASVNKKVEEKLVENNQYKLF